MLPNPPYRLLDQLGARRIEKLVKQSEAPHHPDNTGLCCRHCGAPITHASCRIERRGGHSHRFTNPHGIRFHIGCFSDAAGCRCEGSASTDFTWFAGHAWRIALCGGCGQHLGWRFEGDESRFYGLILDRLVECGSRSSH